MTTIWHEDYRGYRISYQRADRVVWVLHPGREAALDEKPEAGPGEGRVELRRKAKSVIDADIARTSAVPAASLGV